MDVVELVDTRVKHIVGIGSSAGGIEALSLLVAGLPSGLDCSYVVVQHLSPNYKSMLADLLSRENILPVIEVSEGGIRPESNTVYVVPPNFNIILKEGLLHLLTPSRESFTKPSVNLFFSSIAQEYGENSIGIILSGTGSDGTVGIKAIKSAGGTTFAQSTSSAKYTGMPQSAIDSGAVDKIVAPEGFGYELERLILGDNLFKNETIEQMGLHSDLQTLLERVKQRTKIDFSNYKPATLMRRIQRRLLATDTKTLAEYLTYSQDNPEEYDALAKDTLISVTAFFRDKEAFRSVNNYLREIINKKNKGDEIRIWVAGCATGEEAYSFAVLLAELLGDRLEDYQVQIFATDIDMDALNIARKGVYPKSTMSELSPEQVDAFFIDQEEGYQICKKLRDLVVFARQDLSIDPPFLKLDLITCRNVLIYFNGDLQSKVLSSFHYAMNSEGVLFLGRSENCSKQELLFQPVDRRTRIYRKLDAETKIHSSSAIRGSLASAHLSNVKIASKTLEQVMHDSILNYYSPCGVIMSSDFKILHTMGNIETFVNFPVGSPELNLSNLIIPEFKNDLLTAVHNANRKKRDVKSRKKYIKAINSSYCLVVRPSGTFHNVDIFLILFEQASSKDVGKEPIEQLVVNGLNFESELISTREHLQTLVEELATANEEMQALNEEVQASNEEMQATNEELEASNEELQATNEELVSVNEELLVKSAELAATNADFEGVYNTLEFPIMVFDASLFLRRSNQAAYRLYGLTPSSIGRHFARLALPKYIHNLDSYFDKIVSNQSREVFVAVNGEQTFKIFISPNMASTGEVQSMVLAVIDNTDLVKAKRQLEESQEQLLSIMDHSLSVVTLKDTSGRYIFANKRFEEFFGISTKDCIGKSDHQLFSSNIAESLRSGDIEVIKTLRPCEIENEIKQPTYSKWLSSVYFPIFDSDGIIQSICMEASDVTQKRHAEDQLRLAAKVFDRSGEAITITDSKANIITVNDSFSSITGYKIEEVVGKNISILKSGEHSSEFYYNLWEKLVSDGWWQGEIINKKKDGTIYPQWLTINAVSDAENNVINYVAIFSDITAIKSSQRQIEYMATHDELTGLPNRNLFMDRLKHTLAVESRHKGKVAVFFIDLDNFKNINDTLGHDIGDVLLQEAASRLQHCIRDSDTLARLGGDEFTAIITYATVDEVTNIASRIIDFLSASYSIHGRNLFISCSIGISIFPDDGKDSSSLIKNADTAMYRAKESGKGQYQFFAEEMKMVAFQRLGIETGLRLAIENRAFEVYYQPQVNVATGEIVGAEALIRWRDQHLGPVSPVAFIPIAEKAGIISIIGEIVIDKVLTNICEWRQLGILPPRVSINVSAMQLRDYGFYSRLDDKIQHYDVDHSMITIEITESALMEKIELVESVLGKIKATGVHISIDDFGTGYSSLSYLKKLPITELKIDRSFVDGIANETDDQQIAVAIINMAKALNLKIVAEGVETVEQLEVLKSYGCDIVQGYFFYRPLTAIDFVATLKKHGKGI